MTKKSKMFQGMGRAELKAKLSELELELIRLNAQVATGTALKNPSQVKDTKKNMARIRTLLKAKEQ
jgi:ribosomal protein L29